MRRTGTSTATSTTAGLSGKSATECLERTDASPTAMPREHQLQLVSDTGCGTLPRKFKNDRRWQLVG
jgi:hypothetical protein